MADGPPRDGLGDEAREVPVAQEEEGFYAAALGAERGDLVEDEAGEGVEDRARAGVAEGVGG